jgi:hypothetical protein
LVAVFGALVFEGAAFGAAAAALGAARDFFTTGFTLARLSATRAGEGFGLAAFFAGVTFLTTVLAGLLAFFDFAAVFFAGILVSGADRPKFNERAIIQTTRVPYRPMLALKSRWFSRPIRAARQAGEVPGPRPKITPQATILSHTLRR